MGGWLRGTFSVCGTFLIFLIRLLGSFEDSILVYANNALSVLWNPLALFLQFLLAPFLFGLFRPQTVSLFSPMY